MTHKVVAIHQPNFFPWLGYFHKIHSSDVFVFLDNVQFPKTGGTWTNRVKISVHGNPSWITVPVVRSFSGVRSISEISINNSTNWRNKIINSIQMNYGRAPFFKEISPIIFDIITNPSESLAEFNIFAIQKITSLMGFNTCKIKRASEINSIGSATDLLISITKSLDADSYLCGGGAGGYQEDAKFAAAGLNLVYQNFTHPTYFQHNSGEFVAGLSIIDSLFNCGLTGTKNLINARYSNGNL